MPGPTIAPENTGSGTAASPMARPASGDVTLVMEGLPGGWGFFESPSQSVRTAYFEKGKS
ncbi:hypothetical protein GCM10010347_56280 [Streptomyces cirratus]|uniref:Uncharacterized protein n=1 Tax=Streptomyces cirratus TaxID=68187 RepID=A0ABQ3F036_9ACTN|nr:hypothetical protein GCM10010347_56280 [Streptomyces cirratus]